MTTYPKQNRDRELRDELHKAQAVIDALPDPVTEEERQLRKEIQNQLASAPSADATQLAHKQQLERYASEIERLERALNSSMDTNHALTTELKRCLRYRKVATRLAKTVNELLEAQSS